MPAKSLKEHYRAPKKPAQRRPSVERSNLDISPREEEELKKVGMMFRLLQVARSCELPTITERLHATTTFRRSASSAPTYTSGPRRRNGTRRSRRYLLIPTSYPVYIHVCCSWPAICPPSWTINARRPKSGDAPNNETPFLRTTTKVSSSKWVFSLLFCPSIRISISNLDEFFERPDDSHHRVIPARRQQRSPPRRRFGSFGAAATNES